MGACGMHECAQRAAMRDGCLLILGPSLTGQLACVAGAVHGLWKSVSSSAGDLQACLTHLQGHLGSLDPSEDTLSSITVLQTAAVACCSSDPTLALDLLLASIDSSHTFSGPSGGTPSSPTGTLTPKMMRRGKLQRLANFSMVDSSSSAQPQGEAAVKTGGQGTVWMRPRWEMMLVANVIDMMRSPGGEYEGLLRQRSHEVLHNCILLWQRADCAGACQAASSSVMRLFKAELAQRIGMTSRSPFHLGMASRSPFHFAIHAI